LRKALYDDDEVESDFPVIPIEDLLDKLQIADVAETEEVKEEE
jgi:hypothetical protein